MTDTNPDADIVLYDNRQLMVGDSGLIVEFDTAEYRKDIRGIGWFEATSDVSLAAGKYNVEVKVEWENATAVIHNIEQLIGGEWITILPGFLDITEPSAWTPSARAFTSSASPTTSMSSAAGDAGRGA